MHQRQMFQLHSENSPPTGYRGTTLNGQVAGYEWVWVRSRSISLAIMVSIYRDWSEEAPEVNRQQGHGQCVTESCQNKWRRRPVRAPMAWKYFYKPSSTFHGNDFLWRLWPWNRPWTSGETAPGHKATMAQVQYGLRSNGFKFSRCHVAQGTFRVVFRQHNIKQVVIKLGLISI